MSGQVRRGFAAFVAALTVGACGVPVEGDPRRTAAEDVPFDLLAPRSSAPPPTQPPTAIGDSFGAYFVRNGQLVEVRVPWPSIAQPEDAIEVLLAGPSPEDVQRGLRSALVGDDLVRSVRTSAGAAVVDLDQDFSSLASREQLLSLGQIVMTLTTLRGIGSVTFSVDGKRIDARIAGGSLEQGPVSREDYAPLLATP